VAWLAAQLPDAGDGVVVVVASDEEAARRLEADIRFFWGGAHDPRRRSTRSPRCPASTSRRTPICRLIGRVSSSGLPRCTG